MSDSGVLGVLARIRTERTGGAAAATVFMVCALVSWLGWVPLAIPPRMLSSLVPAGSCTGVTPATPLMYVCSMKVAALVVVGPLATLVLLFVLRKPLFALLGRATARLPEDARFLMPPVVATVLFTIPWADVHASTGGLSGILPQTVFPGIVGLFTFAVGRWGPMLQRSLGAFFDRRDHYPMRVRYLAAIGIPLVVSLIITNEQRVSQTALKEQVVVLVGLATGYLALAPRSGDLMSGVRQHLAPALRLGR